MPLQQDRAAAPAELRRIQWDTWSGMLYSNPAAYLIILATAVTLHVSGITDIETAAQAASALRPLAGDFAFLCDRNPWRRLDRRAGARWFRCLCARRSHGVENRHGAKALDGCARFLWRYRGQRAGRIGHPVFAGPSRISWKQLGRSRHAFTVSRPIVILG